MAFSMTSESDGQPSESGPFFVHLLPTLACNLNCPYCYTHGISLAEPEDPDRLVRIAQEVNRLKVNAIHIEGGEPFANSNIFVLLERLRHQEKTWIVTNGTLLTRASLEKCRE